MLALVLALTLTQADTRSPVGVVLTSKRPGAEAVAPKILQRVIDSLKREGLDEILDGARTTKSLKSAGFSDPKSCQGTRSCVSKLAILLGPRAIMVGVDVGRVGKTLAIHLDAMAADVEQPLASLDVSSSLDGWSDAMSAPIVVFARDVVAGREIKRETPPPVLPASDAPIATSSPPRTASDAVEPPLEIATPAPVVKSRVVPWVLTGTAVAAAATGVAFAFLGLGAKSRYDSSLISLADGSRASTLSLEQAQTLAGTANLDFTVALSTALLAAALAGVSIWLFTH